jgi:hypothetical protein
VNKTKRFFIGNEVENTVMKGERTLFVRGWQPSTEILSRALNNDCAHIHICYFDPVKMKQFELWKDLIWGLLQHNIPVTLDYDIKYADDVYDMELHKCEHFIPVITGVLPNIEKYHKNTVFRVGDKGWRSTNQGVYTFPLSNVFRKGYLTPWKKFTNDEEID